MRTRSRRLHRAYQISRLSGIEDVPGDDSQEEGGADPYGVGAERCEYAMGEAIVARDFSREDWERWYRGTVGRDSKALLMPTDGPEAEGFVSTDEAFAALLDRAYR